MTFKVSVGESDFATFRSTKTYYVDKTDILYELVENTDNKVTLFIRPRRFGKTLMMSMMENFFSVRKESRSIFEGFSITMHKEFCNEWMNSYPVFFISFKRNLKIITNFCKIIYFFFHYITMIYHFTKIFFYVYAIFSDILKFYCIFNVT